MSKKEYIDRATEKIYDFHSKKSVSAELEQHIDEKTDFLVEIGYDADASEDKATEAMGDAEEVCTQFGELHNSFYNPFLDIALTVITGGILGALYYLLSQYAFDDGAMAGAVLSAFCLSASLGFGFTYFSHIRTHIFPKILSFFVIAGAGVFNYFICLKLDSRMNRSVQNLIDFILKAKIQGFNAYPQEEKIIGCVCVVMAVAVITTVFSLIYQLKVRALCNTKTDNKINHFITGLCAFFALVLLAGSVLFGVKCFFDVKEVQNSYEHEYNYVINMTEKCNTKEEIIDYLSKGDLEFDPRINLEGETIGYTYTGNLGIIEIGFNEVKTREELTKQYRETYEESKKKAQENSDFAFLYSYASDYLDGMLPVTVETAYQEQCFCTVYFYADTTAYGKKFNKISTSFLQYSGGSEQEFCNYESTKLNRKEKYELYKKFVPASLLVSYHMEEYEMRSYKFKYIVGDGDYNREEQKTAFSMYGKAAEAYDEVLKTAEILKEHPKASPQEIAKLTGCKIEMPKISKEEYKESLSILGSYFDDVDFDQYYDSSIKYCFDGWCFELLTISGTGMLVYWSDKGSFDYITLTDGHTQTNYDGGDGQKKVRVNSGFFDRNGGYYTDPDYVPYFTSDGSRYYYYCKTIEDKTGTVGNTKEYYITDRKGNFYKPEICYINENGYLIIDKKYTIKYNDGLKKYVSPSGEKYTRAFETSWDENGEMVFYDPQDDRVETHSR